MAKEFLALADSDGTYNVSFVDSGKGLLEWQVISSRTLGIPEQGKGKNRDTHDQIYTFYYLLPSEPIDTTKPLNHNGWNFTVEMASSKNGTLISVDGGYDSLYNNGSYHFSLYSTHASINHKIQLSNGSSIDAFRIINSEYKSGNNNGLIIKEFVFASGIGLYSFKGWIQGVDINDPSRLFKPIRYFSYTRKI